MAKKPRSRRRRSAIVPATVLSATLWSGAALVPVLAGCGGGGNHLTVANIGFDMSMQLTVAATGFDLSSEDILFTVAATGFDLSSKD